MINLLDLIQIYDLVLEPELCSLLIQTFDNNSTNHEIIDNDKKPSFTQLNLTAISKESDSINNIHNLVILKTIEYKNKYYETIDSRVFPEKNNFEYFRIKKYNNTGEDLFDTHVDVMDHESSRRFVSFLYYLNDVETGGETVFQGLTIQPKCGRLVIFPPMWMYPHRGNVPISDNKYILTTYLHYK
jgi:prolyl 4-hydroxylase